MINKIKSKKNASILGWLIIPIALLIWELIAIKIGKPRIFPNIKNIKEAFVFFFFDSNGFIYFDLISSFVRALIGFIIGSILGFIFGVITSGSFLAKYSLGRLFNFMRAITPVALVSITVLWFGIGEFSHIFLITWGVFFTVWISVDIGISRVDKRFVWASRMLRDNNKIELQKVFLMSSFRVWLSGLKTAIAVAFILVFVGELAGATNGLGHRISIAYEIGRADRVVAGLILLGSLGAIVDYFFDKIINWLFPWLEIE